MRCSLVNQDKARLRWFREFSSHRPEHQCVRALGCNGYRLVVEVLLTVAPAPQRDSVREDYRARGLYRHGGVRRHPHTKLPGRQHRVGYEPILGARNAGKGYGRQLRGNCLTVAESWSGRAAGARSVGRLRVRRTRVGGRFGLGDTGRGGVLVAAASVWSRANVSGLRRLVDWSHDRGSRKRYAGCGGLERISRADAARGFCSCCADNPLDGSILADDVDGSHSHANQHG